MLKKELFKNAMKWDKKILSQRHNFIYKIIKIAYIESIIKICRLLVNNYSSMIVFIIEVYSLTR